MTTAEPPATGRLSVAPPDTAPSLGAQAVWLLGAKTIGFAMTVALPLVLVRGMSQEEFGLYKQVFFIVSTAVYILPLGFGMSAFYFLPRERSRQGSIVVNILIFHAVMGLGVAAVMLARPDAIAWVFNSPALAGHSRSIAGVIVLWTVASFLEIIPVALQDVRASTVFIVMSQFSKTLLLLVAALAVGTVDAIITASIVQGVLQLGVLMWYLHAKFPRFWKVFDKDLLHAQANYALPLGGSSLVVKLQQDLHHAFVSNAFGPAAFAVYSVGVIKLPLIGILRESVGSVVLPRINELESRDNRRGILELVAVASRRLALVYFPAFALLMVTGPLLIRVLFTDAYVESWPIFAIAISTMPFSVIVLDPVTRAHEYRYFFLRLRIGLFVALTAVLWFFTRSLGLEGVIAAVVVANMTGWAVTVHCQARLLQFKKSDLRLFASLPKIAAAATMAAAATLVFRLEVTGLAGWAELLLSAIIFTALYLVIALQMRELEPEQIASLLGEAKRAVTRKTASRNGLGRNRAASPRQPSTSVRGG